MLDDLYIRVYLSFISESFYLTKLILQFYYQPSLFLLLNFRGTVKQNLSRDKNYSVLSFFCEMSLHFSLLFSPFTYLWNCWTSSWIEWTFKFIVFLYFNKLSVNKGENDKRKKIKGNILKMTRKDFRETCQKRLWIN